MLEVPFDSFLDAFFELERWLPSEFFLELCAVDGVSCIVAKAVGYIGDKVQTVAFWISEEFVNSLDHYLNKVDVLPLVESADVVGFIDLAFVETFRRLCRNILRTILRSYAILGASLY